MRTSHPLGLDVLRMNQFGMIVVCLPGVEDLLTELAFQGGLFVPLVHVPLCSGFVSF
jgi:hypothetical protein